MTTTVLHASCVARAGKAVLILGASGSGKSSLALRLIALGAELVADDRTEVWRDGHQLRARAPDPIRGLIEARQVGILRLPFVTDAEIVLVADLDQVESDRLPPRRSTTLLGIERDLVLGSPHDHFTAAILCYLMGARHA